MIYKHIPLRENDPDVFLTTYIADERRLLRDAILVIPGGGYGRVCDDREGEPIALAFLAAGLNAFVLHYSVGQKAKFPRPLVDASLAMQHIRAHADEYGIDPRRVFAVGFSAGGHLCASLGSLWNLPALREELPDMPSGINRPTGTVLCYAVLSATVATHMDSFYNILGTKTPSDEELARYSIDHCVHEGTSPAFFMHTYDDPLVPLMGALVTMQAMREKDIPFGVRIYPHGNHGIALSTELTGFGNPDLAPADGARWVADAAEWMKGCPSSDL